MSEEEIKAKTLGSFLHDVFINISQFMNSIADKLGLVNNDIAKLGIEIGNNQSKYGFAMIIGATIFCVIVMSVILNSIYSSRKISTDETTAMYILIPSFSIIGYFIFPGFRLCILGPLLGLLLSLIFRGESKKRISIKYWTVPNEVINRHFEKYRRVPKTIFAITLLALVFAAKYLPQDWWSVKYHAIAIVGAIISGIITNIQFNREPFPSEEELMPPSAKDKQSSSSNVRAGGYYFIPVANNGSAVLNENETVRSKVGDTKNIISNSEYASEINPKSTSEIAYESAMAKLNALVGMQGIKKDIEKLANHILVERITSENEKIEIPAGHFLITGNPGTGKTTVARVLANVFYSIGLVPTSKFIEASRVDLVGQYQGHTAKLVEEACNKAMGGVLFIDEAHDLIQDDRDIFGKEAVNTLLKIMEDKKGKFVIIAVGYEEGIRKLLNSNPGLKDRFESPWHIDDYTDEELYEIAIKKFESGKRHLDDEAIAVLHKYIKKLAIRRGTKSYANARYIDDLYKETCSNISERINSEFDCYDISQGNIEKMKSAKLIVTAKDIPFEEKIDTKSAFEELNELIGMKNLKDEITSISNNIKMDMKRNPGAKHPVHILLTGNPGTGKTSVANILAKLFYEIGYLPENKTVDVNRGKMVGKYIGETAPKVDSLCDEAMGGILFIDEAYQLASKYENDFGHEALAQLLIRMENNMGQFCVIAAGYKDLMEDFIDSNPGLKSRFNFRIHLEEYLPKELLEIFLLFVKKGKYIINDEEVKDMALDYFTQMHERRTKNFANGRSVREFFEKVQRNHNNRTLKLPENEQTKEVIDTITKEDLEGIGIEQFI